MWILVCGMKRSGSTVQYQIVCELAEKHLGASRVPWVPEQDFIPERFTTSRFVYKCHICMPHIAHLLQQSDTIGFYSYRDIREACASWIRKNNTSFNRMWEVNFIGECLQNYDDFTSKPNMLVSRYEDFFQDLKHEITRIASHLSISISEADAQEMSQKYSLSSQKNRIDAIRAGKTETFEYGPQIIDSKELLHSNHITAGQTDTWKTFFSKVEIALIEEAAGDWLTKMDYQLVAPKLSFFEKRRFRAALATRQTLLP